MVQKKTELLFRSGTVVETVGETGKYWLCADTQFRKGNPAIVAVRERNSQPKRKHVVEALAEEETDGNEHSEEI